VGRKCRICTAYFHEATPSRHSRARPVRPIYARPVSNDETGLVLVGVAVFFAVLGYLLSRAALKKANEAAPSLRSAAGVTDQLDRVNEALEALTGVQAPARVAWSFCALCLAGAFVSFGLISISVGG
jgi:hypothetical protein